MAPHVQCGAGLDHAWRYFQHHANQRMSVFNFFIFFAGLLIAGLTASIQGSQRFAALGIGLGLLLVLLAFVFWKLDQRACFLIRRAEAALGQLEFEFLPSPAQIVGKERTEIHQSPERLWTHRRSFGLIFIVVALVGFGGIALSTLCFFGIVVI